MKTTVILVLKTKKKNLNLPVNQVVLFKRLVAILYVEISNKFKKAAPLAKSIHHQGKER